MNESGTQRRQHPVNQVFFGLAFNGCCNGARARKTKKKGLKARPFFSEAQSALSPAARNALTHDRRRARAKANTDTNALAQAFGKGPVWIFIVHHFFSLVRKPAQSESGNSSAFLIMLSWLAFQDCGSIVKLIRFDLNAVLRLTPNFVDKCFRKIHRKHVNYSVDNFLLKFLRLRRARSTKRR